jgi:Flp pilus assembly protein TadD
LNEVGLELLRQGNMEEAASSFRKSLALQPDYPEASYNLGAVLVKKGQVDEGIKALEQAVLLKPDFRKAITLLAMAHKLNGDNAKAEAILARAVQLYTEAEAQDFPFAVQVAAKEDLAVAIALANRLSDRYEPDATISPVEVNGKRLYRVRIPADSQATAERLAKSLRLEEGLETWIVAAE